MPGLVSRADKDEDGKTTFQELLAVMPSLALEYFKHLDTDGDGVITADDRQWGPGKKSLRPKRDEENRRPAKDPAKEFAKIAGWDADKDGRITFEEVVAAVSGFSKDAFEKLDTNGDAHLSKEDFKAARPKKPEVPEIGRPRRPRAAAPKAQSPLSARVRFVERLMTGDADGDGSVSFEEAKAYAKNITRDLFDRLDSNGDGFVNETDKNQLSNYFRGEHMRPGKRPETARPVEPSITIGRPDKNAQQERKRMRGAVERPSRMPRPRPGDDRPQLRRRGPQRPQGVGRPRRRGQGPQGPQRPQRPQVPQRPADVEPETGAGAQN